MNGGRVGTPLGRGRYTSPLRAGLANQYVPETYKRKVPSVPVWTARQIKAGEMKHLWGAGWHYQRIADRMSVKIRVVRDVLGGIVHARVPAIKPSWFDEENI
jgi:hypothetical protein